MKNQEAHVAADRDDVAQWLYQAYGTSAGWKNFMGAPMPSWADLPDAIKGHWKHVADEIAIYPASAASVALRIKETVDPDPVVDLFTNERQSDIDKHPKNEGAIGGLFHHSGG